MSRRTVTDVIVKLIVGAGQAAPTPPVGPALGSKGVKSMDFCKWQSAVGDTVISTRHTDISRQEFNARTAHYIPGTPIPSRITVRPDRTFHFTLRTPTTAMMLLSAAGVTPVKNKLKGAGNTVGARQLAQMVAGAYRGVTAAASTEPNSDLDSSVTQTGITDATPDSRINGPTDADSTSSATDTTINYDAVLAARGKQTKEQKAGNSILGTVGKPVSLKHVYEIARVKHVDMGGDLRAVAASVVAQAGSMGVVIVP